ncbi:MAG TPA: aminotransferase class III-fold pyridoxal phosphate-dependent enzyme [Candidatus Bathyarchaeia archaeon]|nr:aminotransferase class III-fold pyridoxal phosphate-dependent enzyme [Candidatus Bathyarchaeia archaeon]
MKEPREQGQNIYARAKQRIPGGTNLLSKRPEMYAPGCWPAFYREARGCEIWDADHRHFYDFGHNAVGSCLLGYAHPDVSKAVQVCLEQGSMCSLNSVLDVALADRLCEIHPWAEQVRLVRGGGEGCAVAVRIARATTGRSAVAICGYHGWHDWYLAANLGEDDALRGHLLPGLDPAGVPQELRGTAYTFAYDDVAAFEAIIDAHGDRLAAVIMEPCRYHDPQPGFLERVRGRAHAAGAMFIFDEITIGWRRCYGGAHLRLGVEPDMAVFAKALGNGHPIGAVIGTAAAMDAAQKSFISSTYWTESVGPAAALATLRVMRDTNISEHVDRIGALVQEVWRKSALKHGLPVRVQDGYACLPRVVFEHQQANELRTLFTQRMLQHGFLATGAFYPTLAHNEEIVGSYAEAVDTVFQEIAAALEKNAVSEALSGPPAHQGFQRLL